MTSTPVSWLALPVLEFVRWARRSRLRLVDPLSGSAIGQFERPIEELTGAVRPPVVNRPRGEQRLLDAVAGVLARPAYSAYLARTPNGQPDEYYMAFARDDDAVLVTSIGDEVRLARVEPTQIATGLAGQLPKLLSAPTVRIEVPAQTAALIGSGVARQVPERTLRSALATAGIPESIAARVLAGDESRLGFGAIAAIRYSGSGAQHSSRESSWTEMVDGGMMFARGRGGAVVWEPLSVSAVVRAVADALGGLGS